MSAVSLAYKVSADILIGVRCLLVALRVVSSEVSAVVLVYKVSAVILIWVRCLLLALQVLAGLRELCSNFKGNSD